MVSFRKTSFSHVKQQKDFVPEYDYHGEMFFRDIVSQKDIFPQYHTSERRLSMILYMYLGETSFRDLVSRKDVLACYRFSERRLSMIFDLFRSIII